MSKISWTEETWNPMTGCTKVTEGCRNCYAEVMAKRLNAMNQKNYINGFKPTYHPDMLKKPMLFKKSKMIFVNSMSDTFHEAFTDLQILTVFKVMNSLPRHTFQVLTKRPERVAALSDKINWTGNIWMGTTVESQDTIDRLDSLFKTGAQTKFVSVEPMIGAVTFDDIDLANLDWVIVGGESGKGFREIKPEWVKSIQEQCKFTGVPFFFKQWGGYRNKTGFDLIDGEQFQEMPV